MPTIYLRKDLYDEIVQKGTDVTAFVNEVVENRMKELREKKDSVKH